MNFWLSYNANNSPKTRAFEKAKPESQITNPALLACVSVGVAPHAPKPGFRLGHANGHSVNQPQTTKTFQALRLGVTGWALCVECSLCALLALSASIVVPRRTTRGLSAPFLFLFFFGVQRWTSSASNPQKLPICEVYESASDGHRVR